MKYELPKLNYAYNALESYIDAQTMEIHYTKHHQAYINNLNAVLEANPAIADKPLEELMKELAGLAISEADKTKLKNNGGGHLNHSLFWELMDPANSKNETLIEEINQTFGSVEEFKKLFNQTAAGHFGSGWTWLARDEAGKLQVYSLPNQDSPYLKNHTPIIGLDIWEHAYYLKYQNRRVEYIENWWKVVKIVG
ncbi:MAG: superoxide dismutase [bacterium]|nr:superoxide dismutase [bacterium]